LPKENEIKPEPMEEEKLNDKLIRIADALTLGKKDITPKDEVPDEVACVQNFCEVMNMVIRFPRLDNTKRLLDELKADPRFEATLDFNEATIIVNATGTGNGRLKGHCGYIGTSQDIISGNSYNGIWEYNYTIQKWNDRFRVKGGMQTYLFRLKE
jgi:hypothetical protein